jgi:hypothetical protein
MGIVRKAFRPVWSQISLLIEKAYVWIDARESRKKIYRIIMLLIVFSLLSWFTVSLVKFTWEFWRFQRMRWQMLEWIPLLVAAEFFALLANLFGPDDRRDPPDDPTCPWPRSPEDNRPEPLLIFECVLDGRPSLVPAGQQRQVMDRRHYQKPFSAARVAGPKRG